MLHCDQLRTSLMCPTVDLLATGCLGSCGRGPIEFVPATGNSNTTCSRWVFVLLQSASVALLSRPLIITALRVLLTGPPTISQVKFWMTPQSTGWRELMFSPCACLLSCERLIECTNSRCDHLSCQQRLVDPIALPLVDDVISMDRAINRSYDKKLAQDQM